MAKKKSWLSCVVGCSSRRKGSPTQQATPKKKTTKLAKSDYCRPNTKWRDKSGRCYCITRGKQSRALHEDDACKKVRRRKAPLQTTLK